MKSLNHLVLVASLLQIFEAQVSPEHCYDFVSTSITDQCGGGVDFTWVGKPQLTSSAGSNGSPSCDSSGCHFEASSYFYSALPSGMSITWTVGIWLKSIIANIAVPFSLVEVGSWMSLDSLEWRWYLQNTSAYELAQTGWYAFSHSKLWVYCWLGKDILGLYLYVFRWR